MARVIHHPHLQTTMHLPTSELDWFKIFAAYNETGVSKPEFYTHHLPPLAAQSQTSDSHQVLFSL